MSGFWQTDTWLLLRPVALMGIAAAAVLIFGGDAGSLWAFVPSVGAVAAPVSSQRYRCRRR